MAVSGAILSGCNGSSSGQNSSGSPIQANVGNSLFATSSCLTGKVNFAGSGWYASGTVDVSNTCASDQSLSGQTISFTSQDSAQKGVAVPTLNNWWINDTAYTLSFTSGSGNSQIGTFAAGNGNPIIKANQTISFNGGLNLSGAAFDNASAQSSFAINGSSPTPTPSPTPTVSPVPSPTPSASPSPQPSPSPTPAAATLSIAVDTVAAGCATNSVCVGLNVNVASSNGTSVASFNVPASSYGATYTQAVTGLVGGQAYSVSGSAISNTTVSYTPAASQTMTAGTTKTVTIKYTQNAPVVTTGAATVSLANVVPNYTGDVQVQLLNTKASNVVVNTYTIKQGGSFSTGQIPATDSTHAYVAKMTTGIADPLQGLYYIESGLPAVKITKGTVTTAAIPMKASTVAKKNVTLVISGLQASDNASVTLSDAANKYKYVQPAAQTNSSVIYKIESNLNLGVSVQANTSNYEVNPINTTKVVTIASTITAAFKAKVTPTPTPSPTPIPSGSTVAGWPTYLAMGAIGGPNIDPVNNIYSGGDDSFGGN